jgi:hypothetical protein
VPIDGWLTMVLITLIEALLASTLSELPPSGPADAGVLRLAEPGGVVYEQGDSRRPGVERPALAALPFGATAKPGVPAKREEGGAGAENTRDLGEHRPGELYLVPGEHRPGDLDRQSTFRPGDLG